MSRRVSQVDGNTDDKDVREKFVGTLLETMKGDDFPVPDRREDGDGTGGGGTGGGDVVVRGADEYYGDGTVLQDLEKPAESGPAAVSGPAVPRQNGYVPNDRTNADGGGGGGGDEDADGRQRQLRYDVRNMYAQIGSYPKDPAL